MGTLLSYLVITDQFPMHIKQERYTFCPKSTMPKSYSVIEKLEVVTNTYGSHTQAHDQCTAVCVFKERNV